MDPLQFLTACGVGITAPLQYELTHYPIGSVTERLPPDRLALRRRLAKLLFDAVARDSELERVLEVYRDFPRWDKFYVWRQTTPCRTYNLPVNWNMIPVYRSDIGSFCVLSPLSELDEVDDWTDEQYETIMQTQKPYFYLDPCAFLLWCDPQWWKHQ